MIKVPGTGPLNCEIAIVGEAPGVDEERCRMPFVGASGRMLNSMLNSHGISRNSVYITNVVKERPPSNNINVFLELKPNNIYRSEAYNMYEQELYKELTDCTANVIVAAGATALYALTRKTQITKYRGSILHSVPELNYRKVIPTLHPANVLYDYSQVHCINIDLGKVAKQAKFPEVILPKRNFILDPTFIEAIGRLTELYNYDTISFDIEVMHGEVSCIAFSCKDWTICIPFTKNRKINYPQQEEVTIWKNIKQLLETHRRVVGHNITFDFTFLFNRYGIIVSNPHDSMVAQAIAYPDLLKGLAFVCSAYTDEPYYKDDGKIWTKLAGGSESDFWLYNAKDAAVCLEAFDKIMLELIEQGNVDTYLRQIGIIKSLVYMHTVGMLVDVDKKKDLSQQATKQADKLEADIKDIMGVDINLSSPKQLMKYFYIDKGYKPYTNRKTKRFTVDEGALLGLHKKGVKEASLILEHRRILKAKSTYYDMVIDDDNRIRCSFDPVGTKNGRISSSETIFGTGGNMQNLTEEMKGVIIADAGYVLYSLDLSQAENRIVAYIAPEHTMISAFEAGEDIHSKTASMIFRKPIEEISREKGSTLLGGGKYSERDIGKRANHGLNYGESFVKFSELNDITAAEAKFIIASYLMAYPGITKYHTWVADRLRTERSLINLMGRRRVFLDKWDDDLLRKGYNFIPQSTVADVINQHGLIFLTNTEYDIVLLNQVHDSIVIEIARDYGPHYHAKALWALKKSLEQPLKVRDTEFVIPVDISTGPSMLAKQKLKADSLDILEDNLANSIIWG